MTGPTKTRAERVGLASKDRGARICQNEHPGARFRKSESWGLAGPTKTRMERVGVARPVKMRTVRLGFTKMGTQVLAFANPRVGGWLGLQKREQRGLGWPGL